MGASRCGNEAMPCGLNPDFDEMISPRFLGKAMLVAFGIGVLLVLSLSVIFGSLEALGDSIGVSGEGLVIGVMLGALLLTLFWPDRRRARDEASGSVAADPPKGPGPKVL